MPFSKNAVEIDIRSTKDPVLSKVTQQEMAWEVSKPFVENGGQFTLGGTSATVTQTEGFGYEEDGEESGSCKYTEYSVLLR